MNEKNSLLCDTCPIRQYCKVTPKKSEGEKCRATLRMWYLGVAQEVCGGRPASEYIPEDPRRLQQAIGKMSVAADTELQRTLTQPNYTPSLAIDGEVMDYRGNARPSVAWLMSAAGVKVDA